MTRLLTGGALPRCLELFDDVSLEAAARTSPYRFPAGAGAALLVEVDGNDEEAVLGGAGARWPGRVAGGRPGRDDGGAERVPAAGRLGDPPAALRQPEGGPPPQALRGRGGAALPHPGADRPGQGASGRARGSRSPPTATRATGTCTSTSSSTGRTSGPRPRRPRPRCCGRRWTWAAPSPASTGWATRSAASWCYEQGPEVVALERRLKAVFDPLGLLNPGKIFAPG